MMDKREFTEVLAKRLRELRLALGHETAASFARAIGYTPDKYSRYERHGIVQTGVVIMLVRAIKAGTQRQVNYDWLFANEERCVDRPIFIDVS